MCQSIHCSHAVEKTTEHRAAIQFSSWSRGWIQWIPLKASQSAPSGCKRVPVQTCTSHPPWHMARNRLAIEERACAFQWVLILSLILRCLAESIPTDLVGSWTRTSACRDNVRNFKRLARMSISACRHDYGHLLLTVRGRVHAAGFE